MKHSLCRVLALAGALVGMALLMAPARGMAEVQRIEIDVAGYLCGL